MTGSAAMGKREKREKRGLRRITLSIGLTAMVVIALILLLTLTVHHAREKEMALQFGRQQAVLARGTAARLEDLCLAVEKSLRTLTVQRDVPVRQEGIITVVYESWAGTISFLALVDQSGKMLLGYPPKSFPEGFPAASLSLSQSVQRMGKADAEMLALTDRTGGESRFLVVAVPESPPAPGGRIWMAALSGDFLSDRYFRHAGETHPLWLTDGQGRVILSGPPARVAPAGRPAALDFRDPFLAEDLLSGREGSGEYRLNTEGGGLERHIVTFAPLRFISHPQFVVAATPYDEVIGLVRRDFLGTLVGAAFLILAVIVAAAALLYVSRRRLSIRAAQARIRDREAWEEKLLREKRTVEGIIEGSPIPTFVLNRDHKIICWNRACTDLTGYSADRMIGTENQYVPFYSERRPVIADLILEKDFESLVKYYGTKRVRKSSIVDGAYEARDSYRDLGGMDRHLYFLAAPIYGEEGEIIAAIETLQDVSREEEMARELREYAETLQNELHENIRLREEIESLYNYLHSIVESLPDRLFVLSRDGRIQYVSKDVRQGIGLFSRPAEGGYFLEVVAPELRDIMKAHWEEARRGIHTPFEVEVRARDGSLRTLLITSGPVRGTDRYLVVQRDITGFKQLEEKFYESQKLAAVGQLSAGIAHEVRNPLSSIKMSLQILEKRMHPMGNDLKRFRIAEREVEHLEQLVNDVLIFAKPAKPQREPGDLRRIVEQTLALTEKGLADKAIKVRVRCRDDLPLLNLDTSMLEQAFMNLILNAIDAMEQDGVLEITLSATAAPDDGWAEVEIRDNGCGIDEKDKRHLFNPFFTSKKYGTGLGLTQVKKIVELHQGSVQISSRKGEGTQVLVRFPLAAGEAALPAEAAPPGT